MKKLLLIISAAMIISADITETKNIRIGTASYYAQMFEGRRTASGEVFRQKGFTAASNFYPLQTKIKVTNLETGDTIVVKVNDRMAERMAAKGRVVDLSTAGADSLKYRSKGLLKVSVEKVI